MLTFLKLIEVVPALDSHVGNPEAAVHRLFYDSRLIISPENGLFFAFPTGRSNGHSYIPQAFEKGIRQWVISEPEWETHLLRLDPDQNILFVENPWNALRELAAWHRSQFAISSIGITGSNGKTIVKEWLSQLTGPDRYVCKSPNSFNSQLGVALSVWNLKPGHQLGIFEAGISLPGEMEKLEQMIRPDLGIFTNLGSAHENGFESPSQKLREKLLLFRHSRRVILPETVWQKWESEIRYSLPDQEIKTWKWANGTDSKWELHLDDQRFSFHLPYSDPASLENLGNAISAALETGISGEAIQARLPLLHQPAMRLSLKEGHRGNVLIDDSYTNDQSGLEAALQFARMQQKGEQPLLVLLSDLEGTEAQLAQLKETLGKTLEQFSVNQLFTIGEQFAGWKSPILIRHQNWPGTKEFLENARALEPENAVILIKGSRRFGFEQVVRAWQKKMHGTRLEINLNAMVHNLNFYRSLLKPGTGIMAMVKALGYGSGDEEIARLLEFYQVRYLAVAYADEGIKLREAGIKLPIMVMNPSPDAFGQLIEHQLEPEIYSFHILEEYLQAGNFTEKLPPIHLKVDTGMHRLGFMPEELGLLIEKLNAHPELKIASVFSHLAGADEDHLESYSREQIQKFDAFCEGLKNQTNRSFHRHILNSAGILRFPEAQYDWVRLGIGLYGIEINAWYQDQLQPVSTLKTTVSQIKELKAGDSVGYGRKTILAKDSKVATIAIGYSDGFRRDFSVGKGGVWFGAQYLPVLGNVCMDMSMVDASGTDLKEGDEVDVFRDAETLEALAKAARTIPYEILTGIGHRVKRIFFRE